MKIQNKGGRPSKNFADRKIFLASTRLTESENEIFQEKVRRSGMKPAAVVRESILRLEIRPRITPEEMGIYKEMQKDLREIGKNFNIIGRTLGYRKNVDYRNWTTYCLVELKGFVRAYKEKLAGL